MSLSLAQLGPTLESFGTANELPHGIGRIWLSYNEYVPCAGDVLLWEWTSVEGLAICLETRGPWCHASGIVKLVNHPFQAAYQEGRDGYLSPLSREVRRNSGKISVFRPFDPDTQRPFGPDVQARVAHELINSLGGDYAWTNIALIYAQRSRCLRLLARIFPPLHRHWERLVERENRRKTSAICSQNLARAWRNGAGIDLVDDVAISLVTPNDIGKGCREAYLGTLTWPEKWNREKQHAA